MITTEKIDQFIIKFSQSGTTRNAYINRQWSFRYKLTYERIQKKIEELESNYRLIYNINEIKKCFDASFEFVYIIKEASTNFMGDRGNNAYYSAEIIHFYYGSFLRFVIKCLNNNKEVSHRVNIWDNYQYKHALELAYQMMLKMERAYDMWPYFKEIHNYYKEIINNECKKYVVDQRTKGEKRVDSLKEVGDNLLGYIISIAFMILVAFIMSLIFND